MSAPDSAAATPGTAAAGSPPRQGTRRNTELVLLVVAWGIGVLAYAQISWATSDGLPESFGLSVGVVGVVALVMHLVVRRAAPYADPILLPTALLLNVLGLAMIYRLDIAASQRAAANGAPEPTPDVYAQLTWFLVGALLFVAVILAVRDHRRLQRFTYTAMLLGLVLLLLPLVPVIGTTVNGAQLWIRVAGFSFQPAELAKIVLTVFFAGYLVRARDSLALVRSKVAGIEFPRGRDLGPLIVAWLVSLGVLVFQRDLGTSIIFFGLFVSLLYIATQRRSWLILGAVLFSAGAAFAYLAFGHVRLRVQVWLDPFAQQADAGYQIVQSLFGLSGGGILGSGLGQGYPQLVPFANTDFIVAAFGEELGITGLFAILVLYAILVERGLRTAIACRDAFGTLLAAGLSIVLALQVFVVVGGVTRLIPLTGLTTPFLSYGGSALVANWMMVALLIRISHSARRPEPVATPADDELTTVMRIPS
ncbi:MAG: FtsW/RodA/SpoVE family cell cycle protein [Actinomycetota bacterium]|nr:MAG: FtsW/RodA/SpoVE family cell cycle protein [Actinomycetota bacterium]